VPLLEPDVQAIAPTAPEPAADRAPDSLATGTPEPLRAELQRIADREFTYLSSVIRRACAFEVDRVARAQRRRDQIDGRR